MLETSGEIHLSRCLLDLKNDYACIDLIVSDPIIFFKETILCEKFRIKRLKKKKEFEEINKEEIKEVTVVKKEEAILLPIKKEQVKAVEEVTVKKDEKVGEWWYNDWSSFEEPSDSIEGDEGIETTKILEEETFEKEKEKTLGDHDDGTKNIDHTDKVFQQGKNIFMYQENKKTEKWVTKKSKGMKVGLNDFQNIKGKQNVVELKTPNGKYSLCIRAVSMNNKFASWLLKNQSLIKKLFSSGRRDEKEYKKFFDDMINKMRETRMNKRLIQLILRYLVTFGPKKCGPNML